MIGKLYILKSDTLKSCFRSHYFLCLGTKNLAPRMNFNMKQFVNIKSGTIVESAIWNVGTDILEVEIDEEKQTQINNILKKSKVKNFISWLDEF